MDTAFCFDTSVVVNSNVSGIPLVPGTFLWFRNDSILLGANNSTYKLEQPGIHRILYFFDQCVVGDTTNAVSPPVLAGPDPVVCVGSPVRIQTTLIPGGVYTWSSGTQLLPFTGNFFDTIGNQLPAINEMFSVNVVDAFGCAGNDSIVLRTTIKPDVDLPDTSGCQGIVLRLDGSPINKDSLLVRGVYTWFESNEVIPNLRDSILSVTTPGVYKVRYELDACFDEDSVAIVFNPLPQLVTPTNVKFCKDDQDSVAINIPGFAAYRWRGPGIDSTDTLATVFASDSGYVFLTVFNTFNCPASDSILILDRCTPRVFVPSGFTPNGDGKDDLFRVFGNYLSDFSMTIYNRWGEVIFYETDITKGWDGTYRGEDMPIGTYPVLVTYKGIERESQGPFRKQASVTLIR
jgi:gliding motility-associated-like protein